MYTHSISTLQALWLPFLRAPESGGGAFEATRWPGWDAGSAQTHSQDSPTITIIATITTITIITSISYSYYYYFPLIIGAIIITYIHIYIHITYIMYMCVYL